MMNVLHLSTGLRKSPKSWEADIKAHMHTPHQTSKSKIYIKRPLSRLLFFFEEIWIL